ncbi:MAG: response regulator transcription factor [Gammaproteobacteria bacterium]|nr:response regulator transcription factor [Gammaproteobacteria bacterium]MBU1655113.1 response regulator transcription factor [Gammaproteobacteria bacterium]MBU1961585.1 response regulator transcription factor [Gammaproteobacteria bacterium]
MNDKKRVIFASDDQGVLDRWQSALEGQAGIKICRSRQDLTGALDTLKPDQYLLDLRLPGLRGLTGALGLIPRHSRCHCLAFSAIPIDDEGIQLLKAGARAYCNRFIAPQLLQNISQIVASGEIWLGASIMERLIRGLAEPKALSPDNPLIELTDRERDIAVRVSRGASNKTIARDLDISERTVKAHLTSIFGKTKARDRLQLALLVKQIELR